MNHKTKKNKKLIRFLKSQSMVSLVLAFLVLFLIVFNNKLIQNEKIYVIEGSNKKVVLKTGSVAMNNKIVFFNGPKISYHGKDVELKNYKMGFYVNNKKIYETKNLDEDTTYSLKMVLDNNSFNFMDSRKNSNIYTKDVIKNIEKMKFKLTGTDKNGKKISISIPLMVSEV